MIEKQSYQPLFGEGRGEGERAQPIDCQSHQPLRHAPLSGSRPTFYCEFLLADRVLRCWTGTRRLEAADVEGEGRGEGGSASSHRDIYSPSPACGSWATNVFIRVIRAIRGQSDLPRGAGVLACRLPHRPGASSAFPRPQTPDPRPFLAQSLILLC